MTIVRNGVTLKHNFNYELSMTNGSTLYILKTICYNFCKTVTVTYFPLVQLVNIVMIHLLCKKLMVQFVKLSIAPKGPLK